MSTTEEKIVPEKPIKKPAVKKGAVKKTLKVEAESATLKTVSRFAAETILEPMVTEKSASLAARNVLVFRVASFATRVAVKQAIKELYNVLPIKVNVITVRPRAVNFGRTKGTIKGYKKAMVTLPAGKTIDVFAA